MKKRKPINTAQRWYATLSENKLLDDEISEKLLFYKILLININIITYF
jgi:hypothetical protein